MILHLESYIIQTKCVTFLDFMEFCGNCTIRRCQWAHFNGVLEFEGINFNIYKIKLNQWFHVFENNASILSKVFKQKKMLVTAYKKTNFIII